MYLTPDQEAFIQSHLNVLERWNERLTPTDEYLTVLIGAVNELAKKLSAPQGEPGFEYPGWDVAITGLTNAIDHLAVVFGSQGVTVPTLANPTMIQSGLVVCPIVGTAVQLPVYEIPFNHELVLKGAPGNFNLVYVGSNRSAAQDVGTAWPLQPSEVLRLKIRNSNVIWVSALVANDGLQWLVEQP